MNKPSNLPWGLWLTLIGIGLGILISTRLYPPSFEYTTPTLVTRGPVISVEFDVINHTRGTMEKKLYVSIGLNRSGSQDRRADYTAMDHREVAVSLAPAQTKHIRCDFPDSGRLNTNAAEVTIAR